MGLGKTAKSAQSNSPRRMQTISGFVFMCPVLPFIETPCELGQPVPLVFGKHRPN